MNSENIKIINSGITAPKGFKATGGAIGIKKVKKDMALISSDVPAVCSGAFTTNVVKATSVLRNIEIVKNKKNLINGIVVNSGNANACTGEIGVLDNQQMAKEFAKLLNVDEYSVLTASTGVIGVRLPIDIIKKGINDLYNFMDYDIESATKASEAILTTDTYNKEFAVEIEIDKKIVKIGAMAKGSGMIHPNMATMLAFITTDINITQNLLDKALMSVVPDTYNMVSVDGDTSTNDTVLILANGLANNSIIDDENDENYKKFVDALYYVNEKLAKELVRDGEGATKFIEVNVLGTKNESDAKNIAKSVIKSNLVKTAFFGADANWGRVICAMGYSGVDFDFSNIDIIYKSQKGEIELIKNGKPIVFDEYKAKEILLEKDIYVYIDVKSGDKKAKAWTCDLSYEYVKINGDYRS